LDTSRITIPANSGPDCLKIWFEDFKAFDSNKLMFSNRKQKALSFFIISLAALPTTSQTLIKTYDSSWTNFNALDDCLYVFHETNLQIWNSTCRSLIATRSLPPDIKYFVDMEFYKQDLYISSTLSKCIYKISTTNMILSFHYCAEDEIYHLQINFNYIYLVTKNKKSYQITILDNNTFQVIKEFKVDGYLEALANDKALVIKLTVVS
jgi:hypothetical protein